MRSCSAHSLHAARLAVLGSLLLLLQLAAVSAQNPGAEWEKLNAAAFSAYDRGAYEESPVAHHAARM
jgi:hypothetical protein